MSVFFEFWLYKSNWVNRRKKNFFIQMQTLNKRKIRVINSVAEKEGFEPPEV